MDSNFLNDQDNITVFKASFFWNEHIKILRLRRDLLQNTILGASPLEPTGQKTILAAQAEIKLINNILQPTYLEKLRDDYRSEVLRKQKEKKEIEDDNGT